MREVVRGCSQPLSRVDLAETAYLSIEVGADQRAAHSDPAGPDVVVLPKQLQPPPPLRRQPGHYHCHSLD